MDVICVRCGETADIQEKEFGIVLRNGSLGCPKCRTYAERFFKGEIILKFNSVNDYKHFRDTCGKYLNIVNSDCSDYDCVIKYGCIYFILITNSVYFNYEEYYKEHFLTGKVPIVEYVV